MKYKIIAISALMLLSQGILYANNNKIDIPFNEGNTLTVISNIANLIISGSNDTMLVVEEKTANEYISCYDIKLEKQINGPLIIIKLKEKEDYKNQNARIFIKIPFQSDIVIKQNVGNIDLSSIKGKMNVDLKTGNISADFIVAQGKGNKINLNVGNIVIHLDNNSNVNVYVSCDIGKINSNYPIDLYNVNYEQGQRGALLIGKGTNYIELKTHVGNIDIKIQKSLKRNII